MFLTTNLIWSAWQMRDKMPSIETLLRVQQGVVHIALCCYDSGSWFLKVLWSILTLLIVNPEDVIIRFN